MNHQEYKILLSGYLDGELTDQDKKIIEDHLKDCIECQEEFNNLKQTKEVLDKMTIQKPKDEVWKAYWSSVYNRLERKAGWIFFSIGLVVLFSIGIYELINQIFQDQSVSLIIKLGIMSVIVGGAILLISVIKEQLFTRKRQRYKEVEK